MKILKGIAVIVVVLGVIYAIAVAFSSAKLRRAYADLEKAGRPMKAAALIPPKVPDTENAALLYESAGLLLRAQPAPGGSLLDYIMDLSRMYMMEPLPPEKLDELQPLIEQDVVNRALWMIEQGTRRPSCWFDRDYTRGVNIPLSDLQVLKSLSFLLRIKACLDARAGRLDDAWNMALNQLRLANALLNEPILIGQLVRIALFRVTCQTIQELCEVAPPNESQYQSLQDLLAGFDDVDPLFWSMDGERLLVGEWAFKLPRSKLLKEQEITGGLDGFRAVLKIYFRPTFQVDHAAYLRIMLKFAQRFERPYSQEEMKVLEEMAETDAARYALTGALMPALQRVKQIQCGMLAELRIVRTGLALLQYKKTEETFPAKLGMLQLGDMKDPFSDGPLIYRTEGEGFVLYSIGLDQKDNGGTPKQEKQKEDWDYVWQFPTGRVLPQQKTPPPEYAPPRDAYSETVKPMNAGKNPK